ncbi:hypothetical protein P12x_002707 [Tundrisphaera lichenicola]|uniref:hypothetical protein n=1 Tax=Tundrisphaera lichenicola TaxID=2029860 RepID=UPI003EB79501
MNLDVAYRTRSAIVSNAAGLAVALAPNLRRDRVSFDATLRHPLRFREAIGALHDVVISDLRHQPRDRSAHAAYLDEQRTREASIRKGATAEALKVIRGNTPSMPAAEFAQLEREYRAHRAEYWQARQDYSNYLRSHDPALWRLLMPCDPVITVSPDVLFFECFSADESSYGCLTVDRGAFDRERDVLPGTTNVDYSWALYEHFQLLRSYRETRFLVDPAGFEVGTEGQGGSYREEKIELPTSWLRGFLRLQGAMSLPMRRVPLSREGLYNVLAFLKRHKAARSPRAVRFELEPGRPVAIVLEPWEKRIVLHDRPYEGPKAESIRVWGRDRLLVLARLLPLLDEAEVYLLGSGLPSFWSIRMGEMRLMLGLSGWTANDWTSGSALDALAPPAQPSRYLAGQVAATFREAPAQTLAEVASKSGGTEPEVLACLNQLAGLGQVIHDLHAGLYRWRQVMPVTLSAELLGPEDPETVAARHIATTTSVRVTKDETRPDGLRVLEGQVLDRPATLLIDADGRMLRGKCTCSHHHTGGLRKGPCRHLQALREKASSQPAPSGLKAWFASLRN